MSARTIALRSVQLFGRRGISSRFVAADQRLGAACKCTKYHPVAMFSVSAHRQAGLRIRLTPSEKCKRKTNADLCRQYRESIKKDPGYIEKNKLKCKSYRDQSLTEDQLETRRAKGRLRAQKCRQRKKAERQNAVGLGESAPMAASTPKPVRARTCQVIEKQRTDWRLQKRTQRAKWSGQKWQRHREACRHYRKIQAFDEKKLFTPGPLGVSYTVKEAMLKDLGSRDIEFINLVKFIRSRLLEIAGVSASTFTTVPIQGSGTFAVEAVFQTGVPRDNSKVLILENGAYGKRMSKICEATSIPYHMESFPENECVNLKRVEELLKKETFSLVSCVHCETSSGVFNPVEEVGQLVNKLSPGTVYFVDAMSSFGAVPLDFEGGKIDFMVSSANKCMQGVPGFSYAVARKSALDKCKGNSRSLSLDLYDQNEGLDKNGQFRFTPATHSMLAFQQAIREFDEEGGMEGRAKRYKENREIVAAEMKRLGFQELLDESVQGYIITSYYYPKDPNFNFMEFYNRLNAMDQVIYPGKTLEIDCFRIGNIGHLYPSDMRKLMECIEKVCHDMNITLPVKN